jgi:hypothetical protein
MFSSFVGAQRSQRITPPELAEIGTGEDPDGEAYITVPVQNDGSFAVPDFSQHEFVDKVAHGWARKGKLRKERDMVAHDIYDMRYVFRSTCSMDLDSEHGVRTYGQVKTIVEQFAEQIGEENSTKRVFCSGNFWCIVEEIEIEADELEARLNDHQVATEPRYISYVPNDSRINEAGILPSTLDSGMLQQIRYYGSKIMLRPHRQRLIPFDHDDRAQKAEQGMIRGGNIGQISHTEYSNLVRDQYQYAGYPPMYHDSTTVRAESAFSKSTDRSGHSKVLPELDKKELRKKMKKGRMVSPFQSKRPGSRASSRDGTKLPLMPIARSISPTATKPH